MSKSEQVKLLGAWASPYVLRARIALNIKSVKYEFLEETLGSKSQLLLQSNPIHKKIPVLIHEDRPVCESLIIVQYVDDVFSSDSPPILPSDPYDRAVARFWASYLDDKWYLALKSLGGAKGEEEKKSLRKEVKQGLAWLEEAFNKSSKGKSFFGGDQMGLLDIAFGCFLGWLRVTEMNGEKLLDQVNTPALFRWAEMFSQHAAVRDVLPKTEKLAEFAKIIRARMAASTPK